MCSCCRCRYRHYCACLFVISLYCCVYLQASLNIFDILLDSGKKKRVADFFILNDDGPAYQGRTVFFSLLFSGRTSIYQHTPADGRHSSTEIWGKVLN